MIDCVKGVERYRRALALGCLPVGLLAVLTGTPALLRVIFSACVVIPGCPNQTVDALIVPAVVIVQGAVILWICDRTMDAVSGRRFAVASTVLIGLIFAMGFVGLNLLAFPMNRGW
jgi:hypothetical protein